MNDLLDILIERASKHIIQELKNNKITHKEIEAHLEKKIYSKVKKKPPKNKSIKLVRTALYISDSSDDE